MASIGIFMYIFFTPFPFQTLLPSSVSMVCWCPNLYMYKDVNGSDKKKERDVGLDSIPSHPIECCPGHATFWAGIFSHKYSTLKIQSTSHFWITSIQNIWCLASASPWAASDDANALSLPPSHSSHWCLYTVMMMMRMRHKKRSLILSIWKYVLLSPVQV